MAELKTDVISVDLDWANDPYNDSYREGDDHGDVTAREYGLEVETLQEFGPGGGWPELRFTGPRDAVERLVMAYANDDPVEAAYLLGD